MVFPIALGAFHAIGQHEHAFARAQFHIGEHEQLADGRFIHEGIIFQVDGFCADIFDFDPIRRGAIGGHQRGAIIANHFAETDIGAAERFRIAADIGKEHHDDAQDHHRRGQRKPLGRKADAAFAARIPADELRFLSHFLPFMHIPLCSLTGDYCWLCA